MEALYADYIDASETATTYINNQISGQRADAALTGVDFAVTDEEKTSKISNYFAEIWSAEDDQKLTKLNDEFGQDRETPYEFLIKRGVTPDAAEEETANTTVKSRGAGTLATSFSNEDDKLSGNSILGGG